MSVQYICPVVTAFCEDGSVDMEGMKLHYDRLIAGGLDGIAVLGSSGEFYSMSLEEAKAFAKESIEYLKEKIPVYVGTGRLIPEETVELSRYVLDLGATAVMIVGPYYIGTDAAGIEAYFDWVAGAIDGDIILYNYPERTGYDITPDIVLSLLEKHKRLIGLKDTVGTPSHTRELICKVKPLYPRFQIYSGFDENFAHVAISGGDGCIAALSNLIPETCARWRVAFDNGNLAEVAEIQKVIDGLMDFYKITTPFMPAMKYALGCLGLPIRSECRMPATEPDARQKALVDQIIKKYKL